MRGGILGSALGFWAVLWDFGAVLWDFGAVFLDFGQCFGSRMGYITQARGN
mgnify:CR=1 FL=1